MLPKIIKTSNLSTKKRAPKIKTNIHFSSWLFRLRKKYFNIDFLKRNFIYIFFSICLLFGIIFGKILCSFENQNLIKNLNHLFSTNYTTRLEQELSTTFISSTTAYFIPVLLTIVFGLSFFGIILVPLIIFIRGLGIGISSSYIYSAYAFKGVLFNLLVVFPGLIFSIIALFLVSREAMNFSKALLCTQIKPHPAPRAKTFFLQISKVFIILVIASLLDLFLSHCFSSIFIF